MAEQKHSGRLGKTFPPGRVPGGWVARWRRKAENKANAQYSTDIIPSKLNAELQHSARLGKTFPVGCLMSGWLGGGERLRIRLKLSTHTCIKDEL